MKKINVLGVEYKIYLDVNADELPPSYDGCMDHSNKTIRVAKFDYDEYSVKDLEKYKRKVLRHEIVHAFLYESGLWNNSSSVSSWGTSEEITDWIAIQSPKLFKAFKEAGCNE